MPSSYKISDKGQLDNKVYLLHWIDEFYEYPFTLIMMDYDLEFNGDVEL